MLGNSKIRFIFCGLAAVALLVLAIGEADARRGGSFGSRGSRTYTAPPVTQTAPNTAAPINRSMTQPQRPAATPGQAGAAQKGGLFNRPGLMGGLMAGFLGAGLLGLLFGNGLLGGLSGIAGFIGLLLQIALVVIVARLAWAWWQRRNAPAMSPAGGPSMRDMGGQFDAQRQPQAQPAYGGGSGAAALAFGASKDIELTEADFNVFEQRLTEVQSAYSAEDLNKLRAVATPEVVSYFAEELTDNASRGLVNTVSDIKLLQGDLAEAWHEDDSDYATVALRYTSIDYVSERVGGKVVEGDKEPFERTEVWTFRRVRGGEWMLSAVQQS